MVVSVDARNLEGIPSTYRFVNLQVSHRKEMEIEIPIKNLTKSIDIKVTAQIKLLNGAPVNLEQSHRIDF